MRSRPPLLAVYLLFEAGFTVAWWLLLVIAPRTRALFFPPTWPGSVLVPLAAGDFGLLFALGIATAVGIVRRRPWVPSALGIHIGGVLYGTLYAAGIWGSTGHGAVGMLLMSGDTVALCALAAAYRRPGNTG